jgi:hypothetical protein
VQTSLASWNASSTTAFDVSLMVEKDSRKCHDGALVHSGDVMGWGRHGEGRTQSTDQKAVHSTFCFVFVA